MNPDSNLEELFDKEIREKTTIIIEPNGALRRTIIRILKSAGLTQIADAEKGKEGWSAIKSNHNVGIVICSAHLDDVDALKILQTMLQDKKYEETTFILVSSDYRKESIQQKMNLGADGYIVKPFSFGDMKAKVEEAVAYHKHKLELRDMYVEVQLPLKLTLKRKISSGLCMELGRNGCHFITDEELGLGSRLQVQLPKNYKENKWFDYIPGAVSSTIRHETGKLLIKFEFTGKPARSQGIMTIWQQYINEMESQKSEKE